MIAAAAPVARASHRSGGFTIIELLVSVAIVGVLAGVAMPVIQTTITREKESQLRLALRDIRSAIDAYKQVAASGNIVVQPGQSGYPPSLIDLAAGVTGITTNQQGVPQVYYFLRSVPRDPFFPDQTTPAISTWGLRSYASPPDNPVAGDDVFDVYSLSAETGLNGIPYNQW